MQLDVIARWETIAVVLTYVWHGHFMSALALLNIADYEIDSDVARPMLIIQLRIAT